MTTRKIIDKVMRALTAHGLLCEADAVMPSLATLIAGEPIKGSWWGHPCGNLIYNTAGLLEESPDVLRVKLLLGKRTYVHRRLWPAILTIGQARDDWQTQGLSAEARALLATVQRRGLIRLDKAITPGMSPVAAKKITKALEVRLLVITGSLHTETGAHTTTIESWRHWAKRAGATDESMSSDAAYAAIESAAGRLGLPKKRGALPWT